MAGGKERTDEEKMNAAPVLCHVRAQNADQATGLNNIKKPGPPIRKHRAAPVATLSILFTPSPPLGELRYCTRGEASRPVHVGVQCTHSWVPQLDPWCGVCVLAPAWGRRAQLQGSASPSVWLGWICITGELAGW